MSRVSMVSPRRRKPRRREGPVEGSRRTLGSAGTALQLTFEFLRSQDNLCAICAKPPLCEPDEQPPLDPSERATAPARVLSESERRRLLDSTQELVRREAKRACRILPWLAPEDIVGYAQLGRLEALSRFDPEQGAFAPFAFKRIRGAILDGVRKLGSLSPVAYEKLVGNGRVMSTNGAACVEEPPQSARNHAVYSARVQDAVNTGKLPRSSYDREADTHVPLSGEESPEQQAARKQLLGKIARCVESLPKEQASLLLDHYVNGRRIDHIAAQRGVDKSWVSRLHGHGLKAIARQLREEAGEPITSDKWQRIYR